MGPRRPDKVSHGQRIGLHLVHPDAFHACAVDRMNDSAASYQVHPSDMDMGLSMMLASSLPSRTCDVLPRML